MRGGSREGSGRKPGSLNKEKKTGRDLIKQIRWCEEEWNLIEEVAKAADKTPSEFIREAALAKTRVFT